MHTPLIHHDTWGLPLKNLRPSHLFHQEKRRAAQRVAAKQLQQVTMVDVGDVLFEDVGAVR